MTMTFNDMVLSSANSAPGMRMRKVRIFDTTLRDGEQAPGNEMTVDQKVSLAKMLADLGVDVIEAGFPAASAIDREAVLQIGRTLPHTTISALSRPTDADVRLTCDALSEAPHRQILLLGTASDILLTAKRGLSRGEALQELAAAIRLAKTLGCADVSVGAEDATRADPGYLKQICEVAAGEGATTIVLADTVGCAIPEQMGALVRTVADWLPDDIVLSVHPHNDLGLAVANALAAISAGAHEVQTTLCGIGERAGNACLEEVVAALRSHPDHYRCTTGIVAPRLFAACRTVIDELALPVSRNKAIVGLNAFASAAGIHQAALLRNRRTYEFVDPDDFGAQRSFVLTRHSGRHAAKAVADHKGATTYRHYQSGS